MPSTTLHKLTDLKCQRAKEGRHSDGGGLYLNVKQTGSRAWLFIYRWGEKRPSIGLGGYPSVSLQDARARAAQCREWLNAVPKKDPKKEWRALQRPALSQETFGQHAMSYWETIKGDFRSAKVIQQWPASLERHAKPIWDVPVDQIGIEQVLSCLQPIWDNKNETARRVRGRIEAVLESARVRGLREGANPAAWNGQLKHVLGKRRPPVKHFPALEYERLPEFWEKLSEKDTVGAMALRFTILTAARSGEVRLATWDEINLENAIWTIPGERMKAGKTHIVPLSKAVMNILKPLHEAKVSRFIFPGQSNRRPLSDMTLTKILRDMKITTLRDEPVTVHGFRSAFSDWARNETDFPRELIEESLAHSLGRVEAAYRRGAAIEKRRELMEAWAIAVSRSGIETRETNIIE